MSEREKKLLSMFAVAGVLIAAFWGYSAFTSYKQELQGKFTKAEGDLSTAQMAISSREAVIDEMDWLSEHEPEPRPSLQVPGEMEKLAKSEANRTGMTVKNEKILSTIEAGLENAPVHYSIAQVEFQVTGTEQKLYDWFDAMHNPDQFRVISNISMMPNKEDDTLIDCTVIFDQWFIPAGIDAPEESAENQPAPTP